MTEQQFLKNIADIVRRYERRIQRLTAAQRGDVKLKRVKVKGHWVKRHWVGEYERYL